MQVIQSTLLSKSLRFCTYVVHIFLRIWLAKVCSLLKAEQHMRQFSVTNYYFSWLTPSYTILRPYPARNYVTLPPTPELKRSHPPCGSSVTTSSAMCRLTGKGHMDINRISGYIPGKIVFFLMQVWVCVSWWGCQCRRLYCTSILQLLNCAFCCAALFSEHASPVKEPNLRNTGCNSTLISKWISTCASRKWCDSKVRRCSFFVAAKPYEVRYKRYRIYSLPLLCQYVYVSPNF